MAVHYDTLIVGGGQGSLPLARVLVDAGRKVALAERTHVGGSCVNFGCTPTKAAIASARIAHLARRASEYGVHIPSVEVDFAAVLDRARNIALESRGRLNGSLERSTNPQLLRGHARFMGRDDEGFRLSVDQLRVTADEVVLDTGSRSVVPAFAQTGDEDLEFITSENWLERRDLPRELLIAGGGYIGLEMAQFYRRMGSHVTVVETAGQVLAHEDRDVADALQRMLEIEGIRFLMNTRVVELKRTPGGIVVSLDFPGGKEDIAASAVFLALGRQPNTDELGLEIVGVEVDERGFVKVNERLATSVPGIWAMGDIRGGPMFTHSAWDDHRIVASQLVGDGTHTTRRLVPYAVFTDPELGRVGMTEREARAQGRSIAVGHFKMQDNGKARELGETRGFIKVVTDEGSKKLLGAAVVSTEAAELVHQYVELMNADAPYTVIERAVYIHPTLAEATQSAIDTLH